MAINTKIESDILDVQRELADISKIRTIDVSVVDDVLALTRNIARTYKEADFNAQRAYLNFFFEKILVENKKVVNIHYQPVIDVLNHAKLGILTTNGLRWLDSVRTFYIEQIIKPKLYEDLEEENFKYVEPIYLQA